MAQTIVQYLAKRLYDLGVEDVFGVPGDYNFHLIEAVENQGRMNWRGCCNELNSGYAADGYARIKGMGALITTFGVGELSAINAVTGSFAESLPVVKIVGMPNKHAKDTGKIIHHCPGKNDYELFCEIYSKVTEYSVILSKENAQAEIEEALSVAYHSKKPVYIGVYNDFCTCPINITTSEFEVKKSDETNLNEVIEQISDMSKDVKNPVIVSEYLVLRYNLQEQMKKFIEKSGFAATTLAMGKSSIDETSDNYIGLFCGNLLSEEIGKYMENADFTIGFGVMLTDFNTGGYSSNVNDATFVDVQRDYVKINDKVYENVYIWDVLEKLTEKIEHKKYNIPPKSNYYKPETPTDKELGQTYVYQALQSFLKSDDIFIAETGMTSFSSVAIALPQGLKYCAQFLWGSIGWATPACLGAAIAGKNRRTVMLTGEGSHQMTAQEISSMMRYGLNPIIIVINNEGYTVERLLCEDPMDGYNDIAKWDYSKLPEVFDGEALVIQARTQKEFTQALNQARQSDKLVYIEAFTPMMDATDFVYKLCSLVAPAKY